LHAVRGIPLYQPTESASPDKRTPVKEPHKEPKLAADEDSEEELINWNDTKAKRTGKTANRKK